MKVAVITGAANGIGLALSQVYLQQDTHVVMVDKDSNKLNHEVATLEATYPNRIMSFSCDVTDETALAKLVAEVKSQYKRVDWIYNNAGIIGDLGPVWELDINSIHKTIDINLLGMIKLIQAFMPWLFEQDHQSHLINMASLYALCTGSQTAAYSMSKHAVLALSESLYFDLNRLHKPVDVSVVFPSFTDTSLLAASDASPNQEFHKSLQDLLSRSRPAMDVAEHIVKEVANKCFYIFPDKEVKTYCQERTQAIVLQENPHRTNIEKLMSALIERKRSRAR